MPRVKGPDAAGSRVQGSRCRGVKGPRGHGSRKGPRVHGSRVQGSTTGQGSKGSRWRGVQAPRVHGSGVQESTGQGSNQVSTGQPSNGPDWGVGWVGEECLDGGFESELENRGGVGLEPGGSKGPRDVSRVDGSKGPRAQMQRGQGSKGPDAAAAATART